jgi:hypothetical protein
MGRLPAAVLTLPKYFGQGLIRADMGRQRLQQSDPEHVIITAIIRRREPALVLRLGGLQGQTRIDQRAAARNSHSLGHAILSHHPINIRREA